MSRPKDLPRIDPCGFQHHRWDLESLAAAVIKLGLKEDWHWVFDPSEAEGSFHWWAQFVDLNVEATRTEILKKGKAALVASIKDLNLKRR